MAVVDPQANITPSYALVQQALQQRATIEKDGGASSPYAVANAIATPIADDFEQQRKYAEKTGFETFKNHLDQQLSDYQGNRKAVTQDDFAKYYDSVGIDKKYLPSIKGTVMLSPEEFTKMVEDGRARAEEAKSDAAMNAVIGRLSLSKNPEDQQKADALRALGKDARKEYAKTLFKPEHMTPVDSAIALFPTLKPRRDDLLAQYPAGLTDKELAFLKSGEQSNTAGSRQAGQFLQKEWDKIFAQANPLDAKNRTTLGLAVKADYNANRALNIFNKDTVTNREAAAAYGDIAQIFNGASATDFGMSEQNYNTLYGEAQGLKQYFTGSPKDAVPNEVKQRVVGLLKDLKATNADVIKQQFDAIEVAQPDVISHFSNQWKNLRSKYEGGVSGVQQPSAEDLIKKVYPNLPAGHTVKRLTKKGTNAKVNMEVDEHGNYLRELP